MGSAAVKNGTRDERDWYRPRAYSHFDARLSRESANSLVSDPKSVAKHAFLPFLSYEKKSRRYKPDRKETVWKLRSIAYAAHADSQIYAFYSSLLGKAYEELIRLKGIADCVLAYRPLGKSNVNHATEVFVEIERLAPCIAMAFDVEAFFESIEHLRLKAGWSEALGRESLPEDHYKVFRSITRYATVDRDLAYAALGIRDSPTGERRRRLCSIAEFRTSIRDAGLIKKRQDGRGIPQGSPMSAVLSNIYMLGFDAATHEAIKALGGLYRRYSDDILVVAPRDHVEKVQAIVAGNLTASGLRLNAAKTEVVEFPGKGTPSQPRNGLQYLGLTYDGARVLLRSSSIARYYQRMRRAVRRAERESAKRGSLRLLFKSSLYRRFSHYPGARGFVRRYALPASELPGLSGIRRQVAKHSKILAQEIELAEGRLVRLSR